VIERKWYEMARQQKVTVVFSDDLTGDPLDEGSVHTVQFSLDGTSYEIDLSAENAQKLRDDVATWIGHARKTTVRRGTRAATGAPKGRAAADREQSGAIREWARSNGHAVSERGRIPAAVVEAFHKNA
jgi:hypothetical protein